MLQQSRLDQPLEPMSLEHCSQSSPSDGLEDSDATLRTRHSLAPPAAVVNIGLAHPITDRPLRRARTTRLSHQESDPPAPGEPSPPGTQPDTTLSYSASEHSLRDTPSQVTSVSTNRVNQPHPGLARSAGPVLGPLPRSRNRPRQPRHAQLGEVAADALSQGQDPVLVPERRPCADREAACRPLRRTRC